MYTLYITLLSILFNQICYATLKLQNVLVLLYIHNNIPSPEGKIPKKGFKFQKRVVYFKLHKKSMMAMQLMVMKLGNTPVTKPVNEKITTVPTKILSLPV